MEFTTTSGENVSEVLCNPKRTNARYQINTFLYFSLPGSDEKRANISGDEDSIIIIIVT